MEYGHAPIFGFKDIDNIGNKLKFNCAQVSLGQLTVGVGFVWAELKMSTTNKQLKPAGLVLDWLDNIKLV